MLIDNRRRAAYAAALSYDYRIGRSGTRFTRMSAKRVPGGAVITLACARPQAGCPFKSRRVVRSATEAELRAAARLAQAPLLRPKARLEVRIAAADGSVWRRTFMIRRGKAPKRTTRCREGDPGARFLPCS